MNDISTLLRHAAETIEATPGADLADADLRRGRRAASRLRTRRLATRGTAVAAVALLVLAVGAGTHGSSNTNAVTLVSYTGAQPAGYVVDAVPAGWTVARSDPSYLVVAPPGPVMTPGPAGTNRVTDHEIQVSWQAYSPLPGGTSVQVGSISGTYAEFYGSDGTMSLDYRDPAGHNIVIQVPPDLHWSATQAATFAEGIHVTSAAAYTGG